MTLYKREVRAIMTPHDPIGMGFYRPSAPFSEWMNEDSMTAVKIEQLSNELKKIDEYASLSIEDRYVRVEG